MNFVGVNTAVNMSAVPFSGVIGLAPPPYVGGQDNIITQYFQAGTIDSQLFMIYIGGQGEQSYMELGGLSNTSNCVWLNITVPNQWGVNINSSKGIYIGGKPLILNATQAVFVTGVEYIYMPQSDFTNLINIVANGSQIMQNS